MQRGAFAWFSIPHSAKVQLMPPVALFCDIVVCCKIFNNLVPLYTVM